MVLNTLVITSSLCWALVTSQGDYRRPPPAGYYRPQYNWRPGGKECHCCRPCPPPPPPSHQPSHGGQSCHHGTTATEVPSLEDTTSTTDPPNLADKPAVALPRGTILLPNGSTRFPNGTILLIRYADGTNRPAARLPSGSIRFSNGTIISADTPATFPPPGMPLDATDESLIDPPLLLPDTTMVFLNGSLWIPGHVIITTVLVNPTTLNCNGVVCHHLVVHTT